MNGATRKLTVASLFSISLSLVLFGGIAVAASSVAHTTLTIHGKPGGNVAPGTTITISGKLNSGDAVCRSGQTIQLIELGVGPVATTVTDTKGGYSFTQTVSGDSAFQTQFAGSVSGVHPDTHVCAASTSRILKVKVKGNGNGNGPGTGVLGESGSAADAGNSGVAFTGRDLLPPFTFLALLVISGVTALLLGRRRTQTRSSG
jgi:hypothetical protein